MLKLIVKLLRVLGSEADPGQISLAFALSLIAGLTPFWSLHNLLVFLLVLFLRVNLWTFVIGLLFFSGIAYLLDPFFHWLGLAVLTTGPLEGLWTRLYNVSLWRLGNFNNSVVMGSVLFSLVLVVPAHLLAKKGVVRYRERVLKWVRNTRLVQVLRASRFLRWLPFHLSS